ncbi:hypothetical protein ACHHYP_02775 [Achlya hypogyna]|uniref:Uncharacterized protein n=1 Tax=Achlya hypogyna TaxID=1202772 RepID=A0A1V9Z5D8_ACHHY|nr:hypothetical protein ACHHYP_02775 [Achlya hypogyna]
MDDSLRARTLRFVQRCNQSMDGVIPRAPLQRSVVARLVAAHDAWAANCEEFPTHVLDVELDSISCAVATQQLSTNDVVHALTPDHIVVAWRLHGIGVVNLSNVLIHFLFPHDFAAHAQRSSIASILAALSLATTRTHTAGHARAIIDYVVACYVAVEASPTTRSVLRATLSALIEALNTAVTDASLQTLLLDAYAPHKHLASVQALVRSQMRSFFSTPHAPSQCIERLGRVTDAAVVHALVREASATPAQLTANVAHESFRGLVDYLNRDGPQLMLLLFSLAHDMADTGIRSMQSDVVVASLRLAAAAAPAPVHYHEWFHAHFSASHVATADAASPSVCLRSPCQLLSSRRSVQYMTALLGDELREAPDVATVEMALRAVKSHAAEHPEFVWTYVSLARSRLHQLQAAAIDTPRSVQAPPSVSDATKAEVREYVDGFLDTGRVSAKLRQRILLQGHLWQSVLRPYLLTAEHDAATPFAQLLGWAQLVHALVLEKAISEAEYAPFVQRMNAMVAARVAFEQTRRRSLASLVRELAAGGDASALQAQMTARVRGQLEQNAIDAAVRDIQEACAAWLATPDAETAGNQLCSFLQAIAGLNGVDSRPLQTRLMQWATEAVRDSVQEVPRLGWLLGATGVALSEGPAVVAVLEVRLARVEPDDVLTAFRTCAEFAKAVGQLAPEALHTFVPVAAVQFLYWVSLRHHYHGLESAEWLQTSVRGLEETLFEARQDAVLEATTFFPVWLRWELHSGLPHDASRIECLAMHFLRIKEHVDVAAITTVCALGKELLRHQETCTEPATADAIVAGGKVTASAIPLRLICDAQVHPCWTRSKKRRRTDDSSSCDRALGLSLFQHALAMVMHRCSHKANLVTALVTILTEHANSRLPHLDALRQAAFLSMLLEMVAIAVPVAPLQPKAHAALQTLATLHMTRLTPWHPRVTSVMVAASLSFSQHELLPVPLAVVAEHMAPVVAASAVFFWSMVNTALVEERSGSLVALFDQLHRTLVVGSSARRRSLDTLPYPREWHSVFLRLVSHWLCWGMVVDASLLEAKLSLIEEPVGTSFMQLAHAAWSQWIDAASGDSTAYAVLLVQLAARALALHPRACGQRLIASAATAPQVAVWSLLVTSQLPPTAHTTCLQVHTTAWVQHVCTAFVTYSTATEPWQLSPALSLSFPAVVREMLAAADRMQFPIEDRGLRAAISRLVPATVEAPLPNSTSTPDELWQDSAFDAY